MKNKIDSNVTEAMKIILNKSKTENINCDQGSEFMAKEFKKLMSNNSINLKHVQVNDHHKLGIIDRFIRTLRGMINKYQSAYKTTRYINILDELVEHYNNSYHSGIQGIPNKPDEYKLKRIQFKTYIDGIKQETKYSIDDNVRFLKNKVMFS